LECAKPATNNRDVNYGRAERYMWSEVKWSEVKWSEVKWSEVEWSGVKWSGVEWSGVDVLRTFFSVYR